MSSRAILILHTVIFCATIAASVIALTLELFFQNAVSVWWIVGGMSAFAILVLGSWPLYSGSCPLTVWENNARERELPGSQYKEACIDRYSKEWFGITPPKNFNNYFPAIILLLPIVVGILKLMM